MNQKSFCFVLPVFVNFPIGGYKVAFEYANKFAQNDYDVTIAYLIEDIPNQYSLKKLRALKRDLKNIFKLNRTTWFPLERNIKEIFLSKNINKASKRLKNIDFICATAVDTAYYVDKIDNIPNTRKFYLIQDYEKWHSNTDEYVLNSYKLPLNKIVIAKWLEDKVKSAGSTAKLIPNGFNFDYFKLSTPIEKRTSTNICMLNHDDDRKRCQDSFDALKLVKEKYPMLKVNIFGVPPRPQILPNWFDYTQKPSKEAHNKIYNDSAIFIAASKAEGMALPPAESMICGCALVCTNIPGFSQYAIHNQTALLSPVYDINKLAENIIDLIENDEKRIKLAKAGNEFINSFTWDKAFNAFIEYIHECNI